MLPCVHREIPRLLFRLGSLRLHTRPPYFRPLLLVAPTHSSLLL